MSLPSPTLTNIFTKLGFTPPTRDDWKFVWFQVVGVATLITANTADLPSWFAYLGLTVTPVEIHWVSVVATIILYLGGRYGASPLKGAQK